MVLEILFLHSKEFSEILKKNKTIKILELKSKKKILYIQKLLRFKAVFFHLMAELNFFLPSKKITQFQH